MILVRKTLTAFLSVCRAVSSIADPSEGALSGVHWGQGSTVLPKRWALPDRAMPACSH